jgi:transposase InsO family protein
MGIDGLVDRSHAPKRHPWRIPAEVEALICELRRAHPRWGPRRLVFEMGRRGYPGLSRSTAYRVLVRIQLIQPVPRRRRRDQYIRWERPAPMQRWQLDVTASLFLAGGRECKVITGVDDHSRYCVIAAVVDRATGRAVCTAFAEAMREYGVPGEVLSDNGQQFTGRFGKPRPAEVLFERICPGERHHPAADQAPLADDHGQDRAPAVRHEAHCRIPGIAGRNSEGGSWV